ncbi:MULTISPECIES: DUF4386 domain-containing protein [unclassified Flavobacterium]|uniref:DUF4386 domain-containing protein n=1 Tax=unclassified Flavobacterium TaxID=196869 RepID=UPI00070FCFCE|nr:MULTISPECIES: DUF4386 domain-containing protein [unclassified Flavobacterium]KRD61887.1 hypothetical protein ASE40_10235 [Flavobacterium sp. Root935]TDX12224.1 uncharacterized protein DUF4386 [Flavobacterium sp. S87F.05.LMB.W.Kidney.N]BDU27590.1 hypothetical protein FLGSB24_43340 [Flavobacterium sp. GSB-24]
MTQESKISFTNTGRIAGLLYLVVVITGIFSLGYVPSKLIVWNNASETFNNIVNSEFLFRLGIVSSLICYTFFLFLPLVLYKLLRSFNKTYARYMVVLAVVSVPISFVNMLNKFAVLSIINSGEQKKDLVMFYLNQYDYGNLIVQIFWGLWLFPFGYLVFKSGVIPKFLGILLMLGCLGYLINFLGNTLLSNYSELGISSYVRLPASIGEIGTCFWLLIMGAKNKVIVAD